MKILDNFPAVPHSVYVLAFSAIFVHFGDLRVLLE